MNLMSSLNQLMIMQKIKKGVGVKGEYYYGKRRWIFKFKNNCKKFIG